jgi:hypothetical protein
MKQKEASLLSAVAVVASILGQGCYVNEIRNEREIARILAELPTEADVIGRFGEPDSVIESTETPPNVEWFRRRPISGRLLVFVIHPLPHPLVLGDSLELFVYVDPSGRVEAHHFHWQ